MKAEIIAIGTEILLGEIVDTNSAWIAERLPELGIDLYYKSVVGDNLGRVVETLRRGWERSDLLILTGGLGPTDDDLTREAIAALLDETPQVDPDLEAHLRAFFSRVNYDMPESNLKQAWLIPSARAVPNPRGTAPGWWVEKDGRIIVTMPGVPPEMNRMWTEEIVPELKRRPTGEVLVTRTLKTGGIGEGTVNEMCRPVMSMAGVGVGTYARADGVHVRLGAKAPTVEDAWLLIRPAEEELDRIFGNSIWGRDEDTFEGWIADRLIERRQSIATMESCTGGLVAATLSAVPGATDFFAGGLVTYTTDHKIRAGVPAEIIEHNGVISAETAKAMALAAAERLDADYGIGVTGVLGAEPWADGEPGEVHIGVAHRDGPAHSLSVNIRPGGEASRRRAVTTTLVLARRMLLGEL